MFLYSIKAVKDKIIIIVIIMIIGEALIYIFYRTGRVWLHFSTFNFSTMPWNRHILRVEYSTPGIGTNTDYGASLNIIFILRIIGNFQE